jgi:GT2 family glycosyltransferase
MHRGVQHPRVSVIIATWNAGAVLGACLDSLAAQEVRGGFETVVVDNASTDNTRAILSGQAGAIRVITNARNVGFPSANNQAAAVARGDVLFFLNPDTELLGPDVLEHLAAVLEDQSVGIAGPMLLNPDGTLQRSCAAHPGLGRTLLVSTGVHRLLPDSALARVAPDRWAHDRGMDTGWLMGAAVAVRSGVFRELGGFWPTMYGEDEDLAYRAQARGLRVRFEPAVKVMHVGNHSSAQRWSAPERAARVARAELAFLDAHYSPPRSAAIRTLAGFGYAGRAVANRLLGRREKSAVLAAMARVYASGQRALSR